MDIMNIQQAAHKVAWHHNYTQMHFLKESDGCHSEAETPQYSFVTYMIEKSV